jgi:hypothetical protein
MDLHTLANFLSAPAGNGRTLEEIALQYGVSIRTAQRAIAALRTCVNIDLREGQRDRRQTYSVKRRGEFENVRFPRAKALIISELLVNAQVMRVLGCRDSANCLQDHVDDLLRAEARVTRMAIEAAAKKLLTRLVIQATDGCDPVLWNPVTSALHIAILADRVINIECREGSVRGAVEQVLHNGTNSQVTLTGARHLQVCDIRHVKGLEDLEARLLGQP